MPARTVYRLTGLGTNFDITEEIARTVLNVVRKGLTSGLGDPTPGKMCVEAAVRFATGESHGDNPSCVLRPISSEKIALNDLEGIWDTNKQRAQSLAPLAIAQLGTKKWPYAVRKKFYSALKAAKREYFTGAIVGHFANSKYRTDLRSLEDNGETVKSFIESNRNALNKVYFDSYHLYATREDRRKVMDGWIAVFTKVLKKFKSPGSKFLYLLDPNDPRTQRRVAQQREDDAKFATLFANLPTKG
jgi:hypothetical protein